MLKASLLAVLACLSLQASAGNIPVSERSQKAVQQSRPGLQRELRAKGLKYGSPIFIRIFKQSSELELWVEKDGHFELFKTWEICRFSGGLGPKTRQGDRKSPEGFYFVKPANLNPYSRFHLSFNLGYPNAYDRFHGYTGSALMVHGRCVSIGCYAMTDAYINEIYTLAQAAFEGGQPFFRVHIFPFRFEGNKLVNYRRNKWYAFWQDLKEGYEFFETRLRPPNVTVKNGRYDFSPGA